MTSDLDLDELERLHAAITIEVDGETLRSTEAAQAFVDALEPHWDGLIASARRLAEVEAQRCATCREWVGRGGGQGMCRSFAQFTGKNDYCSRRRAR